MHLLDLTLPTAAENLALDEALLLEAEAGRGGEVLRFWEWLHPAVVLGAGGVIADDVNEDTCAADGVPSLRRGSGGGTVLLGNGCFCFSLILSMKHDPALAGIRSSYAVILSRIAEALEGLLPDITIAGISDLASEGRKFSGNAQQRKRTHLLHHGTILYAFDLSLLDRYLRLPPRQPEYRAARGHADFVRNLPCSADELQQRLRREWQAHEAMTDWPQDEVRQVCARRYGVQP
jgi:lipoate-protein ligase A